MVEPGAETAVSDVCVRIRLSSGDDLHVEIPEGSDVDKVIRRLARERDWVETLQGHHVNQAHIVFAIPDVRPDDLTTGP
jgi:hypothetical protein